jgi:hypothetical protein
MSRLCLVLLLLLSAGSLAAQTVVRPDPPLDAERLKVRDAVLVLRDSLNSIDAAAARLQRDFRTASGASLVSRARVMREACARSARTIPPTRQVVAAAPASNENRMKRRDELARGLDRLRDALKYCEDEFAAMSQAGQGERVRGYANDRARRVQTELRAYARTASRFLSAMGIKVVPLGAEPRPLAG